MPATSHNSKIDHDQTTEGLQLWKSSPAYRRVFLSRLMVLVWIAIGLIICYLLYKRERDWKFCMNWHMKKSLIVMKVCWCSYFVMVRSYSTFINLNFKFESESVSILPVNLKGTPHFLYWRKCKWKEKFIGNIGQTRLTASTF